MIRMHPDAVAPKYAHNDDACFDLCATEGAEVPQGLSETFGTGFAFDIPAGYVMLVFARSGMAFKEGLRPANCVGVIDAGFQGEVKVRLTNDSNQVRRIEAGQRIAQAMLIPVPKVTLVEQEGFDQVSERGAGGFGSSGK